MANRELYTRWMSNRAALVSLDEELYILGRWKRCSTGFTHLKLKEPLPPAAAKLVVQFMPIYHQDWIDSLVETLQLLQARETDICSFEEHDEVIARLDVARESLNGYEARFNVFNDYLRALNLPTGTYLPEREVVQSLIHELKFWSNTARDRWLFVRRWTTFYNDVSNKSCYELKKTLRLQLQKVMLEVHNFAEQWKKDSLCQRILSELRFITERQTMVDNLGDPTLTKRDMRKMFLPLNLPFDEDVSEDYAQTITFRQAVTLGLSEATRLRGYIWDARGDTAEDPDAKTTKVLERIAEKRVRLAAEVEEGNKEEAAQLADAQRVLQAARHAVEHRMGSRLWTAGTREAPRVQHCWAGCELCASVSIVWVAVPLKATSPQDPFVLCQDCMPEYEANPLIHKEFVWLWISHLLCGTFEKKLHGKSVAQMAEATMLPVPSTLKTRALPSAPPTRFNGHLVDEAEGQRHTWRKNQIRREYFEYQESKGFVSSGDEDEDAGTIPVTRVKEGEMSFRRIRSQRSMAKRRSRNRLLEYQKFEQEWQTSPQSIDALNAAGKGGLYGKSAETSRICRRLSSRYHNTSSSSLYLTENGELSPMDGSLAGPQVVTNPGMIQFSPLALRGMGSDSSVCDGR